MSVVEARGALPRTEIGTVHPGAARFFARAPRVGRNVLGTGDAQPPRRFRGIVYVDNHRPANCAYRCLWRIDWAGGLWGGAGTLSRKQAGVL